MDESCQTSTPPTQLVAVHRPHDTRAAHIERLAPTIVDGILLRVVAFNANGAVRFPTIAPLVPDVVLPAVVEIHRRGIELDLPGTLFLA